MSQISASVQSKRSRPEMIDPNERRWNGVLISTGTGFFIAMALIIGIWFAVTRSHKGEVPSKTIGMQDQRGSDIRESSEDPSESRTGGAAFYTTGQYSSARSSCQAFSVGACIFYGFAA